MDKPFTNGKGRGYNAQNLLKKNGIDFEHFAFTPKEEILIEYGQAIAEDPKQKDAFYAVQKTVSGRCADSIISLCLRIQCAGKEEAALMNLLCQCMDWQSGVLVAGWDLRETFERERIPWIHQNTCYCYGNISEEQEQQTYLDDLSFPQKVNLWLQFLESGFDYAEFAWLYAGIAKGELNDRTEWELALYTALNQLEYTLRISESEFELYDGKGERRYFSFGSEQNAQRVFLKLLFPVNM